LLQNRLTLHSLSRDVPSPLWYRYSQQQQYGGNQYGGNQQQYGNQYGGQQNYGQQQYGNQQNQFAQQNQYQQQQQYGRQQQQPSSPARIEMTSVNHINNGAAGGNDMNAFFSEVCCNLFFLFPRASQQALLDLEQDLQTNSQIRREIEKSSISGSLVIWEQGKKALEGGPTIFEFWEARERFCNRSLG